ncbi:MAG: C1 family peptidase [Dehalococcoidia bacterium]|jgi:C1A family cysteine protease
MVSNRSKKLNIICSLVILFGIAVMPFGGVSDLRAAENETLLQVAPVNPEFLQFWQNPPETFYGYIPPPVDLSYLDEIPVQRAATSAALPSSFDWRNQGKVTPVKDQGTCGTCWIFGTTSVLESAVLMGENISYNFAEQSVALCLDRSWVYLYDDADEPCGLVPGHGGGTSLMASEAFIKKGAVLESCNSYNPSGLQCDGTCVCDNCTPVKVVNGYRYVTGNQSQTALIKQAIYDHGPVTVAFYYDAACDHYILPDPPYGWVYDCAACTAANHMVSIIGWDDSVPHFETPGTGAWLVKNSWGTGWGNNGYFWLAYNSSCMTEIAYLKYKNYDPNEKLYYWDEAGWVGSLGYTSGDKTTAWMANIFTMTASGTLTNVDFWATGNNASYAIYIYQDGNPANGLTNLRASQSGTCQEAGYYSIALSSPVSVSAGLPYTIAVKMTTPGYNYPLPIEYKWVSGSTTMCDPPIQTGVSYYRHTDTGSWADLAASYNANACLRARVVSGGGPSATIEVTAPSAMAFGNFTVGNNTQQSATNLTVVVTGTPTSWTVTAKDQNVGSGTGYMLSGATQLTSKLQISNDNSTWADADSGITYNGTGAGNYTLPLWAKQNIVGNETVGSYNITIVFTGEIVY